MTFRENKINIDPHGVTVAARYNDFLYAPGVCLIYKLCERQEPCLFCSRLSYKSLASCLPIDDRKNNFAALPFPQMFHIE